MKENPKVLFDYINKHKEKDKKIGPLNENKYFSESFSIPEYQYFFTISVLFTSSDL